MNEDKKQEPVGMTTSDADAIQKAVIDAIEDFGIERFAISLCEPPECVTEAEKKAFAFGWWKAMEAQRLAQPQQEPVAYPEGDVVGPCICGSWPGGKCLKCPRITTPPQREWVGLTDEELGKVLGFQEYTTASTKVTLTALSRAIEAKLKEKNT